MRKPTFWFPTSSDTNKAVQLQKMASGLKFWIKKVEGLPYLCSERKGADQLRVFVFAYAKCWFSHEAAQMFNRVFHWLRSLTVSDLCKKANDGYRKHI